MVACAGEDERFAFFGECLDQPFDNPFTYFPADVTIDGQLLTNAGVRKKGFCGSLDIVKPGLKIDLTQFRPNDAIRGIKKFTLNNAKQDPSLIRQCLGYQLFEREVFRLRDAISRMLRERKNLGVFANVEEIRKPLLGRYFGNDSGNLYEGTVSDSRALIRSLRSSRTRIPTTGAISSLLPMCSTSTMRRFSQRSALSSTSMRS